MKIREYKFLTFHPVDEWRLNNMAEEGWKVINVQHSANQVYWFILERIKTKNKEIN